ncbi:YecA family protein [Flavobacterium procerum]|uniref:YecA family protein n=1 Tax=Flavobacterium procerum TaxID=1455569 RepID=A0ABV6BVN1_9FLAO
MKIGRNDSCPCGSGQKYKKCCINSESTISTDTFLNYLKIHDTSELLKMISLVQLLPINQSKLIRLESIQDLICSHLKTDGKEIDYDSVKRLIGNDYAADYREDPAEACGTENFMFFNGNNIVFPGIAKDSTLINQMLFNSIFAWENDLSPELKRTIHDGAYFMLFIHNMIAENIGLKRYLFEDDWKGDIYFPESSVFKNHKDLFEFTREDIDKIYEKLHIEQDVILHFVATREDFIKNKGQDTVLVRRPFIKLEDKFYLALPSAQMYSLNIFIRKQIELKGQTEALNSCYAKMVLNESYKYLNVMWDSVDLGLELQSNESLWQMDANKYAYVRFISKHQDNDIKQRADSTIAAAKINLKNKESEFLSITIFAGHEIDEVHSYPIEYLKETKYQIAFSFFDLERIFYHWKPDELTLWKYAKAEERADKADMKMMPIFSILSYFQWYKRNQDSFFPTDDAAPNFVTFDFSTQAKIIAESAQKTDRHFVMQVENKIGDDSEIKLRNLPVVKTKDYAPIYTSEEIYNRKLRIVLEAYPFPIWFSYDQRVGTVGSNFIESMVYWLNEFASTLSPYLENLGNLPIEFILSFDERLQSILSSGFEIEKGVKINVKYEADIYLRKIKLKIPIEIFSALHRKDNYGEQILIDAVLKSFNVLQRGYGLKEFTPEEKERFLVSQMPLNSKKMLLTSHKENDFKRFDKYIPKPRYIQDADISVVLESQIKWMNLSYQVPEKINDIDKVPFLNELINTLTRKLKECLKDYNAKELLVDLMLRHESIIQSSSSWDLDLPARIKCFEKYQDVITEYKEDYNNVVKSSHSLRSLIEYTIAESPEGSKILNIDDVDFLLAMINEIIFYGTTRDSISLGIDNPKMGLLPSGRLGMDHDFHDTILAGYKDSIILDEIQGINEDFESHFQSDEPNPEIDMEKEAYYDKITNLFEKDLGIDFYQIGMIAEFMAGYCFSKECSWWSCTENELTDLVISNSNLSKTEVQAFLSFMQLESRGKIENVPEGHHAKETWIWRFNRKLSYIRRPIIKLKQGNSEVLLWSARHLVMASDNLKAIFYNGTLKVDELVHPNITALLNERLNIKSNEFRTKVLQWFKNTSLQVIENEIKIRKSVFPNADRDYGDIDLLTIDHSKKIVYLIECKNTKQAKVMYDFHFDSKNYLEKQLPKHIKRGGFISDNLEQLSKKINVDLNGYTVSAIVISSYQLPVKYLHNIKIPIYSFQEIKRERLFA